MPEQRIREQGQEIGHQLLRLYQRTDPRHGRNPEIDRVDFVRDYTMGQRQARFNFCFRYGPVLQIVTGGYDHDHDTARIVAAEALETFHRGLGYYPYELAPRIERAVAGIRLNEGPAGGGAEAGRADAADAFTYGHLEAAHRQLREQNMRLAMEQERNRLQEVQRYAMQQRRIRPYGQGMMWVDDPFGAAAEIPKPIDPEASARGMKLFKANLTQRQRDMVEAFDVCVFRGGKSQEPYFLYINKGTSHNIYNLHGKRQPSVRSLCFKPNGGVCEGDVFVAQKMALETREPETVKVANIMASGTHSVAKLQHILKVAEG